VLCDRFGSVAACGGSGGGKPLPGDKGPGGPGPKGSPQADKPSPNQQPNPKSKGGPRGGGGGSPNNPSGGGGGGGNYCETSYFRVNRNILIHKTVLRFDCQC